MKKKLVVFLLTLSLMVHLAGCAGRAEATDLMEGIQPGEVTGKEADPTFRKAEYDLALQLFCGAVDNSERDNLLISPLSIQLALAMTANGAAGQTRREMESLLGGGIPLELLNEYLYTYRNSLPNGENSKLTIANSIWYREDEARLQMEEAFLQKNGDYYDAQMYQVPFDNGTLKDINAWVEDNTDGMIDKILEEIDPDTMLYLINALAFDSKWQKPYKSTAVHPGTFRTYAGTETQADMMYSEEHWYLEDENTIGFMKAYKGGAYTFAALLPSEGTDIYDYVSNLTAESLMTLLDHPSNEKVETAMPGFTFDYSLSMNSTLQELGMKTPFDADHADFSSMGHSTVGNLYIGDVVHKTHISVDKEGTKAAAVTNVEIVPESAEMEEVKTVHLNRPFLFFVLDRSNALPIFMGIVTDPT